MNDIVKLTPASSTFSIPVEGMTCASCVRRVEKAAEKVSGVHSAVVNFATHKLTVQTDDSFTAGALAKAITKTGYDIQPEVDSFIVKNGKDAQSRDALIDDLAANPNVISVDYDAAKTSFSVHYLFSETSRADFVDVITRHGFKLDNESLSGNSASQASHAHHQAEEMSTLRRDFILAAIFATPLFILEMGGHLFPNFHHWLFARVDQQTLYYIYFALSTFVIFVPGLRFITKGLPALFRGAPEMNSLVALGVLSAYLYSTVVTFVPDILPENARYVYFEAASVIVALILLGRMLEARASGQAGNAILKLASWQAKSAQVERDGVVLSIPRENVILGDVVIVRPGEQIAVDGTVVDGSTFIDESMISGEPVPVQKNIGDGVIGGTINKTGAIKFKAMKIGADTMLAQIIKLVEDAQGSKLPIQLLVDRVTSVFVPAVIGIAILTFIAWAIFGPQPAYTFALINAVAVLIIACPCAMGLATPTSIMVGTGTAAQYGVLFRKGEALQQLKSASIVVVDKTGTVTKGHPELTDMLVKDGSNSDAILAMVAAVENLSEHPIAQAIVNAAKAKGLALPKVDDFESITGFGVQAKVNSQRISIGADRFMHSLGGSVESFTEFAERLGDEGKTPLYAMLDGDVVAAIAVADPLKPTSVAAIHALKNMGIEVVMVTGDNARTANAIAKLVGINRVIAQVLPEGKIEAIHTLRKSGAKLAFVGDGINDAPALAEADIGIAIGTGTDVAIESADVVLVGGELTGAVHAIEISRATLRNIKENLFWAFGYNVILIPIAAGVLYPFYGILLSPMLAAGAMALSSVFVVGNALRLKLTKVTDFSMVKA